VFGLFGRLKQHVRRRVKVSENVGRYKFLFPLIDKKDYNRDYYNHDYNNRDYKNYV
jgi:hypothetical protein